jgi:sugar lactone lactonase YvrE
MKQIRILAALVFFICPVIEAGPPQFWRIEKPQDLLEGETDSVSIDSRGFLELGPSARLLAEPDAARLWSVAGAGDELFVGSGDEGRIFRIRGGEISTLYDASEIEAYAVVVDQNNHLLAATAPDGKIYRIDEEGESEVFYDPEDRYIWALCFDPRNRLWIATGLPGRLHRVDRDGKGTVAFATPAAHVTALACAEDGSIYAGTTPDGVIYRLDAAGRVSVMHDSDYEEIKSLLPRSGGSVYAAVVQQSQKETTAPPIQPAAQSSASQEGQVIVTETFAVITPVPGAVQTALAATPGAPTFKGAVLKIDASGDVDTIWRSTEETPQALVMTEDGLMVGVGQKGRLYRLRDDRTWSMAVHLPAEHVTGLLALEKGRRIAAVTSNPSKIFMIQRESSTEGSFVSAVKDAQTIALWGHVGWDATLPKNASVSISTRSGNTSQPDGTWSAWSSPYSRREGDKITSPAGRFLQLRARLAGSESARPRLHGLSVAYLPRNRRPEVENLEVYPPGVVFQMTPVLTGDIEILGLDVPTTHEERSSALAPAATTQPNVFGRRLFRRGLQTFTWNATDPNGDTLIYDVEYRPADGTRYRTLREGLAESVWTWDTSSVPNGRYVLRVVAHDRPSNPESMSLSGEMESVSFSVDNTPPHVKAIVAQSTRDRIRVVVRDEDSVLAKAEYAVNGGEWHEVYPSDGINDELEETYDFAPIGVTNDAPNVVVVRVTDLLGNTSSSRVDLP